MSTRAKSTDSTPAVTNWMQTWTSAWTQTPWAQMKGAGVSANPMQDAVDYWDGEEDD